MRTDLPLSGGGEARGTGYVQTVKRRRLKRLSPQLGLEPGRPQRAVVDILQRHGHDLRGAVDCDVAEELQPVARRQVLSLLRARRLHVDELRSERIVEL